jgi:hypothetical protein
MLTTILSKHIHPLRQASKLLQYFSPLGDSNQRNNKMPSGDFSYGIRLAIRDLFFILVSIRVVMAIASIRYLRASSE